MTTTPTPTPSGTLCPPAPASQRDVDYRPTLCPGCARRPQMVASGLCLTCEGEHALARSLFCARAHALIVRQHSMAALVEQVGATTPLPHLA